jgi:C-terminal processing protease CtpA/Prc
MNTQQRPGAPQRLSDEVLVNAQRFRFESWLAPSATTKSDWSRTDLWQRLVQTLKTSLTAPLLKVTVAKWLTPAGDFINEKGLEPQVKVEITEADAKKEIDTQLNKAIELLKTKKK